MLDNDDLPTTIFVPNCVDDDDETEDDIFVDADDNDYLDGDADGLNDDILPPITLGASDGKYHHAFKEDLHRPSVSRGSATLSVEQQQQQQQCKTTYPSTPQHHHHDDHDDDDDDKDEDEDEDNHCNHAFPPRVSPPSVPREITIEIAMPIHQMDPLQAMYQQGLRKLAKSMKHSDLTRSAIKRQCSSVVAKYSFHHHSYSSLGIVAAAANGKHINNNNNNNKDIFFLSPRCQELEKSRQQLLRMIHRGA